MCRPPRGLPGLSPRFSLEPSFETLPVLGSRVRNGSGGSSSCCEHDSRQRLLTGTYWPQLPRDSARRNAKYLQKPGPSQQRRAQSRARCVGRCSIHSSPRFLGSSSPSLWNPLRLPSKEGKWDLGVKKKKSFASTTAPNGAAQGL